MYQNKNMTNTVNDPDINNFETVTDEELKLKVQKILSTNTNNNEEDLYQEIDNLENVSFHYY